MWLLQCPRSTEGQCAIVPDAQGHVSLNDSWTEISNGAFLACTSISSVNIPNTVTIISGFAFSDCTGLANVSIPNSVTLIDDSAFSGCTSLVSVSLGSGLTQLGDRTFSRCSNLTGVIIPNSVTAIGDFAFAEDVSLASVTLPDTLELISAGTFSWCPSLASIRIPNSVTAILSSAFDACGRLNDVQIPDSVRLLGNTVFSECTGLTTVEIPNSVTSVGIRAFFGCISLTTVVLPSSLTVLPLGMFSHCTVLFSVVIPDTVQQIGDFAFALTSFNYVQVPPNAWVAQTAFVGTFLCAVNNAITDDYNDELEADMSTEIIVSAVVPSFSYYQCPSIATLVVAPSVLTFRPYSVASTVFLNNITFPSTVQTIEESAFLGCSGLRTVRIHPQVNVSPNAFFGCGCPASLYTNGTALQDCVRGYVNASGGWVPYSECDLTTTFEATTGSYTSDYICSALTACEHGITTPSTATTDRRCAPPPVFLSTADKAAIAVGVAVVMAGVLFCLARLNRQRKEAVTDLVLHERLLQDEQAEKETLYAENVEMKRAWEIAEKDLALECELASGGFGSVWRAQWGHINVAVKMLRVPLDDDVGGVANEDFNREVTFMQKIRHPNLLIFYGAGVTTDRRAFLVVELMPLGSLRKMLLSDRELSPASRQLMALDVARGMAHLHGLDCIHRDLKSDNCLVGDDYRVKVGDFGTSRLMRTSSPQHTASFTDTVAHTSFSETALTGAVGTPLWMAPELMQSESGQYGKEVDVYSFGIVLWELMARRTPWEEEITVQGIEFSVALRSAVLAGERPRLPDAPEFPGRYVEFVQQCWAGNPTSRPTFAQVVTVLEAR